MTSLENFTQHPFHSCDQENFHNSILTAAMLGWAALKTEMVFCKHYLNLI